MESIFNNEDRRKLISRIEALTPESQARWGKMNVYQMLLHIARADDMLFGRINVKRAWIGRLIGKAILKKALAEGRPFGKNSPTAPMLKISETSGDFEAERQNWIRRLDSYNEFDNDTFVHPFFGKMTRGQIGHFVYKHFDHHLRQFGA